MREVRLRERSGSLASGVKGGDLPTSFNVNQSKCHNRIQIQRGCAARRSQMQGDKE